MQRAGIRNAVCEGRSGTLCVRPIDAERGVEAHPFAGLRKDMRLAREQVQYIRKRFADTQQSLR